MELFKREKYLSKIRGFYNADDMIKVITGVRRCGKSCLMQTIMGELSANGVPADHLIYLNLDSRSYRHVQTAEVLDQLIASYASLPGRKYLFIDEIQNVSQFERVINSFREDGDFSIFITGSNSYLLSGELVTKLTGRYIAFELYTFFI